MCGEPSDDWVNGGCIEVYKVVSSRMVSKVLVLSGVGPILRNGYELRSKLWCIASGKWNVSRVTI